MNRLWKKFGRMTDDCYRNMIGAGRNENIWHKTFDILIQAIEEERSGNPDFGKEFFQVDDETDFEYGVEDWLMDYLDELGTHKMHERRYEVCEKLIGLFAWEEQSPAEFKFEMYSSLAGQGKVDEAAAFCEKWHKEEPEEPLSGAAMIYARMDAKDYDGAEQIVGKYISRGDACTEDNELIYIAAIKLYEEKGDKETAKQMKKSQEEYEESTDQELMDMFGEEFPFSDEFDHEEFEEDEFDEFDEFDEWGEFDEWDEDGEWDEDDEWVEDDEWDDEDEIMGQILQFPRSDD